MLMMEIEADPLNLKDPLDCSGDLERTGIDSPGWVIPLEPQIVSDVVSKEGTTESEVKKKKKPNQRGRKFRKADDDDGADVDWRAKVKKKRKTKRVEPVEGTEEKSVSDEENLVPKDETKKVTGSKVKRENYLKKYKLMREKRSFVCDLCKKTFITASHLKEHMLSHCQCFPCGECNKVFNHLRSLQRHVAAGHNPHVSQRKGDSSGKKKVEAPNYLRTETPGDKSERCRKYYEQLKSERKYQCEICQKTFITGGHLSTHMHCHSDKKWICEGCGKNFSCERSLVRHKDTFPGEHWFPCELCDMTFFRVINIVKHMEIKHPEAPINAMRAREMNLPLEMTQSESSSRNENEQEGSDDKVLACTKCLKVFFSHETLEIHKQAMHSYKNSDEEEAVDLIQGSEEKPKYKCDVCSKEFISLEGFEYHKNNQHVEKEPKKKKKKKRKSNSDERRKLDDELQEREHLTANFVCKICSKSFFLKSSLQVHLKSHNVTKNIEVRTGSHQCCICPRSFASSDGLKYHLATHTGERRYSCSHCGKKFIKKTHLSEHIATHSKVKYFKCLRCPRTFSTHSAYRKHIKHFPGPHSFTCNKCGKLFMKESMIEKHACVDLVKITMAPEVKALLSEDMIEEYLCLAEEQAAEEMALRSKGGDEKSGPKQGEELKSEDQKSHSCYKCFKIFPSLSSLQSHQLDHIGKQNYQCRFCPESFKRADAFGAHIRNHLGSTPYMCLKCNRKFISPLTLSMHAKNYPGEHSFTCQKCQRWFPSEKRVESHECILQNSDVFVCACNAVFRTWNELLQHAGSKPYKCCSCDLKYPTLIALARHIKKHTGVRPFSCEVCGKAFRAKNNYLYHKNLHADTKEFQCEHCDFKSKSQKRMNFHLFRKHDVQTNTTSTLCPFCGIIFPYMSHMKKHVEAEHGNEITTEVPKEEKKTPSSVLCTLCGKLLNNKYTLANHMKKVHDPNNSKQEEELRCEVCGDRFRSAKRLQRHAEIHEPPGLRTCEVCNKEFYFAKDLRKHLRKHDTNKPYSCLRCGKNFKVSVSLKYHSSICGNVPQRQSPPNENVVEVPEQIVESFPPNIYTGHIEPLDLNRAYAIVCTGFVQLG